MKIDKTIGVKVSIHKNRNYLGGCFDGFKRLQSVKAWVAYQFKNNGIVEVSVSQNGGYFKSFRMNTNK